MKTKYKIYSAVIAFIIILSVIPISAKSFVSPAEEILAAELEMAKSSTVSEEICFNNTDFTEALGVKAVEKITVTSLPSKECGKLMLGGLEVMKNQVIGSSALSMLRFVPTSKSPGEATCEFTVSSKGINYDLKCSLFLLERKNEAPVISENKYTNTQKTYCDIECGGCLSAIDKENDELNYKIVSSPEHGTVKITDKKAGLYTYTPDKGFSGKDSFEYICSDIYGNSSKTAKINIKVKSKPEKYIFDDMNGHWANSAAIAVSEANIMNGTTESDIIKFNPEKLVTRSEFLVACMKAADYELGDIRGAVTAFSDNSEIFEYDKPYVSLASSLGFICGSECEESLKFRPQDIITRSEAAIMVTNIFSLECSGAIETFSDETEMPVWGEEAIYTLSSLGVIAGCGNSSISPLSSLTRAEAAKILSYFI